MSERGHMPVFPPGSSSLFPPGEKLYRVVSGVSERRGRGRRPPSWPGVFWGQEAVLGRVERLARDRCSLRAGGGRARAHCLLKSQSGDLAEPLRAPCTGHSRGPVLVGPSPKPLGFPTGPTVRALAPSGQVSWTRAQPLVTHRSWLVPPLPRSVPHCPVPAEAPFFSLRSRQTLT